MGKDLAARFPQARDTFAAIDEALGLTLSTIMFEGPEAELTATRNTQPAILAHSAAVFAIVGEKLAGTPVAGAGHSLGEYSAYVTAGALKAADAAKLVRRRGELMQQAGEERPGTMAAVLGLPTKEVEAACAEASQQASVAVAANINAPDQTVISGDPDAVTRAGDACKQRGAKRVIALKVSGAFHSPLMGPARKQLQVALERAEFNNPAFPIIANATAETVKDASRARRLLADQLTAPVRWVECMQHAAQVAGAGARFIEIGPGAVLAGLLKRIVPEANVVSLGTADEVTRFMEAA
jgi:[acyl-carrier-protein] S-malonyltransferase